MSTTAEGLGFAAALAALPGMGPRRLTAMLDAWSPEEAWRRATSGRWSELRPDERVEELLGRRADKRDASLTTWCAMGERIDPHQVARRHEESGVLILLRDDPAYPEALLDDLEPPAVLFSTGPPRFGERPRVAIVGTRRCTGVGAGFSRELGHELTLAGVSVVSGLALGIDGAAHRGALEALAEGAEAEPIGVVGSGLDVVYPARHRDLWRDIATQGVLLSEAPLGVRPSAWRFPARNRLLAALAHVVVVVESHEAGGSLHTVDEAHARDVPVMAVPGSVRSPAAGGTNALLAEGCHPVCDVRDVLVALGITSTRSKSASDRPHPGPVGQAVLEAFDWEPATFEHLAVRSGLSIPDLAMAIEALQAGGWVQLDGGWYERVGSR